MSDLDKIIDVKGYKLLIAMPAHKDKSEGGILYADEYKAKESTAAIYGMVLSMGPEAYKDKEKFPEGPRCAVGDWVMFASFTGRRFKIRGQELRLLNDDSVDAVISDPRLIERA